MKLGVAALGGLLVFLGGEGVARGVDAGSWVLLGGGLESSLRPAVERQRELKESYGYELAALGR